MDQAAQLARPALDEWQAELVRLTAFLSPDSTVSQPSWWQDLVGGAPDSRVIQPKIGSLREEGQFDDARLILSIEPMRVDWLLAPIADEFQEQKRMATIGPFSASVERMKRIMFNWINLQSFPNVQRIAFGAVLLQPTPDRKTGYGTLSTYLPSIQMDYDASDFSYQINRPRLSRSLPELRINRLSKWSVMSLIGATISIAPEQRQFFIPKPIQLASRLELDINTAQEYQGIFTKETVLQILQELTDLATELARDGDIK